MATVQPFLSPRVRQLEASRIREVANAGLGRPDVLAFWFGESDSPTPAAIGEAASASLAQGETFYSHNLGLPSLREAIADYTTQLHQPLGAAPVTSDRVAVTSGGVNGLMLAVQALVEPGDEVLAVTPVWPNLTAQPRIMGAHLRTFALQVESGAWQLDVESLCAAITPQTRLLILNAPNNPTGWTLTRAAQAAILARCRATGTWILAEGLRALVLRPLALRAVFSGCGRCARPVGGGAEFFQKFSHDRLALGLVGHARRIDRGHGQTH